MSKKDELLNILLKVSELKIDVKTAEKQILHLYGVNLSLLKKAYDLIPDGTQHQDLVEIKKALFNNKH